jgi:hypothetical protein
VACADTKVGAPVGWFFKVENWELSVGYWILKKIECESMKVLLCNNVARRFSQRLMAVVAIKVVR